MDLNKISEKAYKNATQRQKNGITKMKVYIAGKISGEPNAEKIFKKYENFIQGLGYIPINPYEYGKKLENPTYEDYIFNGLSLLRKCDKVCFIPNWKESKGATLEKMYAEICGKKMIEIREVEK